MVGNAPLPANKAGRFSLVLISLYLSRYSLVPCGMIDPDLSRSALGVVMARQATTPTQPGAGDRGADAASVRPQIAPQVPGMSRSASPILDASDAIQAVSWTRRRASRVQCVVRVRKFELVRISLPH